MALNRQIQATCLLLLLLTSLTSTSVLSRQVRAHRAWAQQAAGPGEGTAEGSRRPPALGRAWGRERGHEQLLEVLRLGLKWQGLGALNEFHSCLLSAYSLLSPILDNGV